MSTSRPPIDLRSDTVTRPTPAMLRAMTEAPVGDDVFGDDPTVKALEARTAELLGKEAAVYMPSGTMANQIAVGVHTRPGDELICAATSHVYLWEAGGIARHSGVTARTFEGDFGILPPRRSRTPSGPTTRTTSGPAWSGLRTRTIAEAAGFTRSRASPASPAGPRSTDWRCTSTAPG